MRYQQIILSALAGLVFANGEVAARSNDPNAHDALPLEDLRDIPVPTHTMATSATEQDIPYATTAAIASVSSHVAAVPLSVFPAATNVPINVAGPSAKNAGTRDTLDSINIKRASNIDDTRHFHKRAACDPRPTLPTDTTSPSSTPPLSAPTRMPGPSPQPQTQRPQATTRLSKTCKRPPAP
jgi:hypothetical protein